MITQQEAKALYDASGAEVQDFLTQRVEKYIREAATAGRRTCTIHVGAEVEYMRLPNLALYPLVIAELKRLGFSAKFEYYDESYVPRGLADDAGEGPLYKNYGFIISW